MKDKILKRGIGNKSDTRGGVRSLWVVGGSQRRWDLGEKGGSNQIKVKRKNPLSAEGKPKRVNTRRAGSGQGHDKWER